MLPKTELRPHLESLIDPWLEHMAWRRDFASWREHRINQEYYQEARFALVDRVISPIAGKKILDLGAGMGGFSVAAALHDAHVVACDYNPAYCAITAVRAERYDLDIPICNAAGEQLPLPSEEFDLVTCWDVLEHVASPEQMMAEIRRVLKPGGHAIITVINRYSWVDPHYHMCGINWIPRPLAEQMIALRGRSKKEGASFRDKQRLSEMHYYTYNDFVTLAAQHGFLVRDLREEQLREGSLPSVRPAKKLLRGVLRSVGLEHHAYRIERRWVVGMYELALCKAQQNGSHPRFG
jgi:ubiquinone/menaquinone biosynthesis C-methylase UbiE